MASESGPAHSRTGASDLNDVYCSSLVRFETAGAAPHMCIPVQQPFANYKGILPSPKCGGPSAIKGTGEVSGMQRMGRLVRECWVNG